MQLTTFRQSAIILTAEETSTVLDFFFSEPSSRIQACDITLDDRRFAQALLVDAIDKSHDRHYLKLRKRYFKAARIPDSFGEIREIVARITISVLRRRFQHATPRDLKNPNIFASVRDAIYGEFSGIWSLRLRTGELDFDY